MPRLFVRQAARADIAEAFQWYRERADRLAEDFLQEVYGVLHSVEASPKQFPVALDDIRKAPLRRFPYVVYFVILRGGISVIAVTHGRRDPRRWSARR